MPSGNRSAIPRELVRAVLVEAGHRCAIPTCRQPTTELHHIEPWAKVKEHKFDNLIALCPNDHARAGKGEIDRQAMLTYKRNLAVLTSRYGESERRLLDLLAGNPTAIVPFDHDKGFDFYYLLEDGILERRSGGAKVEIRIAGSLAGPRYYALTAKGREFHDRWVNGTQVD